jgi:hypothetical protein
MVAVSPLSPMKRLAVLAAALVLNASCFIAPVGSPQTQVVPLNSNYSVVVSDTALKTAALIEHFSREHNQEVIACVERWRVKDVEDRKFIYIDRIGPSPVAWKSDSVSVYLSNDFYHACFGGTPSIHTHIGGEESAYHPSHTDIMTAFNLDYSPFSVILVLPPSGKSVFVVYAIKP